MRRALVSVAASFDGGGTTVIGGLNWGLVGFFDKNLVTMLFGDGTTLTKIVYDLVGLAAVAMLVMAFMNKDGAAS